MFDYFKNIKARQLESQKQEPKKDKVFIAVLAILAVMFIVGLIKGSSGGAEPQTVIYGFSFPVSDFIFLAVIVVAYVIVRIRKGGNG